MPTRFEHFKEAVYFLRDAAEAIDQSAASINDGGLDDINIQTSHGPQGIQTLSHQVSAMLKELETANCPECNHFLTWHFDQYGCKYERGDLSVRGSDGHSINVAGGPCGCEWGRAVRAVKTGIPFQYSTAPPRSILELPTQKQRPPGSTLQVAVRNVVVPGR